METDPDNPSQETKVVDNGSGEGKFDIMEIDDRYDSYSEESDAEVEAVTTPMVLSWGRYRIVYRLLLLHADFL